LINQTITPYTTAQLLWSTPGIKIDESGEHKKSPTIWQGFNIKNYTWIFRKAY